MRVGGKLFGLVLGFMFGNVFGALLGLWLGHRFDKGMSALGSGFVNNAAAQEKFLYTSFAVMGHIAKSKGVVTQQEIQVASLLMQQLGLRGDARERAQQAFRDGKASDFPLEQHLREFTEAVGRRRDLLQMFLEIQLQGAFADGVIDSSELRILEKVASALGFSQAELKMMIRRWEAEVNFHRQRHQQQGGRHHTQVDPAAQLKEAYQILGVAESDNDQQVKRAYRKLMSQHHPDKLVAKGLPAEMMELAKQKAQDIQQAYELVKQQRGMR
ncbi:co-chaperone DjlA [Aliagarivorans marinus]|uniref:co-chaperone DjlA n=1 Tax=Aliagarivorans marinus TaxID=561965 RepID=UPI000420A72A|nr:co-chaperone DjlA [Aliagarivorans marinus]